MSFFSFITPTRRPRLLIDHLLLVPLTALRVHASPLSTDARPLADGKGNVGGGGAAIQGAHGGGRSVVPRAPTGGRVGVL